MRRFIILCGMLLVSGLVRLLAAQAAVEDVSTTGFTVRESADIAAFPDQVYRAISAPSHWWSPDHTYSGNTANLSLDARAGGCWCETLPAGGSVQHMVVINAMPGKLLRLSGALGPLQAMAVDGTLTFAMLPDDRTTRLTLSYAVGGYSKSGFPILPTPSTGSSATRWRD